MPIDISTAYDVGVIAGRAALQHGESDGTAASIAGAAVALAGGDVDEARAAGQAMCDGDRDAPGYGVSLAQCASNAVGAWNEAST